MGLLERRIGLLFGLFILLLALAGMRASYLVAFKGDDCVAAPPSSRPRSSSCPPAAAPSPTARAVSSR